MPFRLTEYDFAFGEFVQRAAWALASARSPMLAKIPVEQTGSTVSSVVDSRDEGQLDFPGESVGFSLTSNVEAVRQCDVEAFVVSLAEAADEYGEALVGMLVQTMTRVTDATGNVVKAEGGFTFDAFYAMLDKMEWSLDDNDELVMPGIFVNPETAKKLPSEATAEEQARLEDLKRKKHEELLARRRRRRLS